MSGFKGTPGPWCADADGMHVRPLCAKNEETWFACASVLHFGEREPAEVQRIANARLIAAAPELLEVCEKIVDYRRRTGPLGFQLEKLDDFIHMAKVAISKAMGDQ